MPPTLRNLLQGKGVVHMQTLRKMLSRRGYDVPKHISFSSNNTTFSYFGVTATDKPPCLVAFSHDTSRVGVGLIRDISKMMQARECIDTILVSVGLTSNAASEVRDMLPKQSICNMSPNTLVFDWYEHKSVPRHVILNQHERAEVLDMFKVKATQLPSIHLDDPACKYLGAHPGDIFKITRMRPNVGESLAYRHVSHPTMK